MNFNIGLFICAGLLGAVILLYFFDPEEFLFRIGERLFRIKIWYKRRYGKMSKELKDKRHILQLALNLCRETISKYAETTPLSSLEQDETFAELLKLHKEMTYLYEQQLDDEYTMEKAKDYLYTVSDIYEPLFDSDLCINWESA